MTEKPPPPARSPIEKLEVRMQKVSLLVSLAGIGLMCSGFITITFTAGGISFPGAAVLALSDLMSVPTASPGLILASAGVVLLGVLPGIRVVLALWLYFRLHDLLNMLVALIVLLELLLSIHMGS